MEIGYQHAERGQGAHDRGAAAASGEGRALPKGFKRRLLRQLATEIAPLLLFFLVFMWKDLLWATGAYAVATAIAFTAAWYLHRRIPILPTISTALVLIFAGLTLVLDNALFIKIKPTVVNGFYGIVLGGGWLFGYRLVEKVLGPDLKLDETGLRRLTVTTSLYLIGLACLNEVVWRSVPTESWVVFKVFVMVAFNLLFAWSQVPVIKRHASFVGGGPASREPAS